MLNDNTHINYSKADIEKYLQGKMSASEMHALEKAALQDPFLADAIEGFEIADTIKTENALAKTEAMILASNTTKKYALTDIEQYFSGKLSNAERYALEKAAIQDPFLADAMEGYEKVNFVTVQDRLQTIATNISGVEKQETKVVAMNSSNNKEWLRYAAAVILMVGIGSTVWLMNKKTTTIEQPIAQTHEEVKNAPSASVQNSSGKTNEVTTDVASGPKNEALNSATKSFPTIKPSIDTKEAATIIDNKEEQLIAKEKIEDAVANRLKVEEATQKELLLNAAKKTDAVKSISTENKDYSNVTASAAKPNTNRSTDSNITPFVSNNSRNYSNNADNRGLNVIRGRITDDKGEAIPAANINIKTNNQNFVALSDNKGNFSVKVADTSAIASVQSIGYEKRQLKLNANTSNNIVLDKENQSLSEVVVVGYGASKKKSMTGAISKTANQEIINTGATPVGGWKSFNDYLQQKIAEVLNNKTEEDGDFSDVTIEFKVNDSGNPYNIKTQGTNNKTLSQKAIEIIKEGPKWQADKKAKKVKLVLQF